VSRVTGWVVAASVVMLGAFSAYVGHAFPGTRSTSVSATQTTTATPPPVPAASGAATPAPTVATYPPVQVPVRTHASTRAS